jgi:multidrug efflux system outer membrane protein
LQANLEQTKARYAELSATYRGSVLTAFRDVEDSLTDLHLRADEAKAQNQAVRYAREYLRLSQVQYRGGLATYLQVIDAERTLLTNELLAVQILNQRLISTVLLIKSMGGGWDVEEGVAMRP